MCLAIGFVKKNTKVQISNFTKLHVIEIPINDKSTKCHHIWSTSSSPPKPFHFTNGSAKKYQRKNEKSHFYKFRRKSLREKLSMAPNINSAL